MEKPFKSIKMKLLEILERFSNENSCKLAFIKHREAFGITCKHCKHKQHYWKKDKEQWECKNCHFRTTIKSGTVMHNSKLPFRYWFLAIHLLTSTKNDFSAKEVQHQLGHKRYEPIWAMLHKLRGIMGEREEEYIISEALRWKLAEFRVHLKAPIKTHKIKTNMINRTTVVLTGTSTLKTNNKDEVLTASTNNRMKIRVFKDLDELDELSKLIQIKKQDSQNKEVKHKKNITKHYNMDAKKIKENKNMTKKEIKTSVPLQGWASGSLWRLKKMIQGVHHRIDGVYLSNYINAFVYKLNRRDKGDLFYHLLQISVQYKWNEFRQKIE